MSSLQRKWADHKTLYTIAELVQPRRTMLRFARSLPLRSSDRNQRRQIAASLRTLFNDKKWLDANTVEGSQEATWEGSHNGPLYPQCKYSALHAAPSIE